MTLRKVINSLIIIFLILLDSSLLLFLYNQIFILFSFRDTGILNSFILFITFLALCWYALETKRIREIEQKPIIDLYYRPRTPKHQKCLKLRNSGKGTAYNIRVQKIEAEDGSREFEFYFDDPNLVLMPDREQILWVQSKDNRNNGTSYQIKEQALDNFLSYIKEQSILKKTKIKIIVSYENYLQKRFEREFYFYHRHFLNYDEIYKKDFEVEFIK